MTTLAARRLDHLNVQVSIDTVAGLSAAVVERIIQSVSDLIAVAQIPLLVVPVDTSKAGATYRGAPSDRVFTLRGLEQFVWWPAGQAASVIQAHAIQFIEVSYSNPAEVAAAVSADPRSVAELMQALLHAGPQRKKLQAEALKAQLEAMAEEALFPATVDEKFHLKERARVVLEIEEEHLMQERLVTIGKQLDLVERYMTMIERATDMGIDLPKRLAREQVVQLLDNVRLLDAFETLDLLEPSVSLTPAD